MLCKDAVLDKDQVDDVGHFRPLQGTVTSDLSINDSTASSGQAPPTNSGVVENSSFDSLCLASQRHFVPFEHRSPPRSSVHLPH